MLEALALGDLPDYQQEGWKITGLFLEGRPSKDGWQRFKARLSRTEDGKTEKRAYRGSYNIKRGEQAAG